MLLRYRQLPEEHTKEHVTINREKRQMRDLVDAVVEAVEDAMDRVHYAEVLGQEMTDARI